MRWANGRPVEGIASEAGVPTDPQDNSSMAINYKTEPMWFRFGLPPDAPFGHADGHGYGDVPNAHMAFSNALVGGDPQTPVLYVKPGQPFRTHILMPTGGSRGSTFQLDGHVWSVNPFQSEKSDYRWLSDEYPWGGFGAVRLQPDVDVHRRPRKHPAGGALQLHAPERRGQQCNTGRLPVPRLRRLRQHRRALGIAAGDQRTGTGSGSVGQGNNAIPVGASLLRAAFRR